MIFAETLLLLCLELELDIELVFTALLDLVEAGDAELLVVSEEEEDKAPVVLAGAVVDAGAALDVTQEQTSFAEVWTMRPVVTPQAAMTQAWADTRIAREEAEVHWQAVGDVLVITFQRNEEASKDSESWTSGDWNKYHSLYRHTRSRLLQR